MIEVFTANTPKGIKVPIALEELGVPYDPRDKVHRPANTFHRLARDRSVGQIAVRCYLPMRI
jgi:glutathione S-transferase